MVSAIALLAPLVLVVPLLRSSVPTMRRAGLVLVALVCVTTVAVAVFVPKYTLAVFLLGPLMLVGLAIWVAGLVREYRGNRERLGLASSTMLPAQHGRRSRGGGLRDPR